MLKAKFKITKFEIKAVGLLIIATILAISNIALNLLEMKLFLIL